MRTRGLALTVAIVLTLWGCGGGRRPGQTTKVIVEPTVIGINVNCPEAPAPCPSVSKEASEQLKQEVKQLEHNCPKGDDLLITPPASSKCVQARKVKANGPLLKGLPGLETGKRVVAQSGCLACHKIGRFGNAGPGPDLSYIGSRLSVAGIERALVDPRQPMPSFRSLPPQKLKALVAFLSLLRNPQA